MSSFQQFTSEVCEKKYLNSKVLLLRLKLINPATIDFVAGQYIALIISLSLRRSYSIFSPPLQKNHLDLIIDVTPGGPGTTAIKNINVGQKIDFLGPLGKFVCETAVSEKNIYFVVTGTGFSPAHSMICDIFRRGGSATRPMGRVGRPSPTEISLLYGCSYKSDFVAWNELKQLAKDFPNFKFIPCVSREEVAGEYHGRVTDYLSSVGAPALGRGQASPLQETHFFVCGNREMVNEVINFLKAKNVPDTQISIEKY